MAFHHDLKAALIKRLGKGNVTFYGTWDDKTRGIGWADKTRLPVALLCHHTAGAATDSTNPDNPGNSKKADQSQATYVQTHYKVPAANFTLGRSGHLWVHSAYPVWHAGRGSFKGVAPYNTLGIPDDQGNDWMLGVECVSKGLKKDFTAAEKHALGELANACRDAAGWKGFTKRLPRHRDWTSRKIDVLYTNDTLIAWAEKARR
jgi:hypothetical protein